MKIKESSKQKYYMRNVYINQIMKPEIQNNMNYAYFDDSGSIPNYPHNPTMDIDTNNIFFNNNSFKDLYQNYYQNQENDISKKFNKQKFSNKKYKNNESYYQNPFIEFNEDNIFKKNKNKKNYQKMDFLNERSFSENNNDKFNQTQTILKKKVKNNNSNSKKIPINNCIYKSNNNFKNGKKNTIDFNYIYMKEKNEFMLEQNKRNKNGSISCRNTNNHSSVKSGSNSVMNTKNNFYNGKNKSQNYQNITNKNTFYPEMNKNTINQINNIICVNNNNCTTSPNFNGMNNNIKKNFNMSKSMKFPSSNIHNKNNKIISYKNYYNPHKNLCYKSMDKNLSRNIINNFDSPQRINNENKNIDNISSINSPSIPSYSSVIEDNSINSKNYVWVKKNIKNNNNMHSTMDNNYLYNYYKKPNINQDNSIQQNLINFANDITNINPYLYNTEIIFPRFINKNVRKSQVTDLYDHSATLIQSFFRTYLVKKKLEIFYFNSKYYYHKGFEILELTLEYFFKKNINIIAEKRKFFNYLILITKKGSKKIDNTNIINKHPKSYINFKMLNSSLSPVINNVKMISKFYHDLFLHKEIGERFNIIKENKGEKDIEKRYKEKIDIINIKVNKLTKENNMLKDIRQKNIVNEKKYREISKENKKKDDIISIITNDNKALAKKLKIIQSKFNKLQIQNQDYINYNSPNNQFNKSLDVDIFEEYRNLFLSFLFHKMNEKFTLSILRKYINKWKNKIISFQNSEKINNILKIEKLKNLIHNKRNKEKNLLYKYFIKLRYQTIFQQKQSENNNDSFRIKKLLDLFKNKEASDKLELKAYFLKFYYKGIFVNKKEIKNKNIIEIKKDNYGKIQKLLKTLQNKKKKNNENILREYFIKWHLYTKVLALKSLINDKRRKKRQKQKLKKKNENNTSNKCLTNNKILHFGKSNIYILNKEKEKDLLISLEEQNQNYLAQKESINIDNKLNNVIQATNKLGEIFYKAAAKYKFLNDEEINKNDNNENNNKNILSQNYVTNKNEIEEDEDSGDSFGI